MGAPEDVPQQAIEKEKASIALRWKDRVSRAGSRQDRRWKAEQPLQFVLLEQPSIRDPNVTVGQLVVETTAKTGENITIGRFRAFALGNPSNRPDPPFARL